MTARPRIPDWLLRSPLLLRAAGLAPVRPRPAPKPLPVEHPVVREVKSSLKVLSYGKKRRAMLRKAKRCINGWSHGRATHGCRCKHCHDVHRGKRKRK